MARAAAILVNLGSPETPAPADIRRFLRAFLSDRRVVELPRPLWQLALRGFVLPLRARSLTRAYQAIWQPDGSPLVATLRRQAAALAERLDGDGVAVFGAVSYGTPSLANAVAEAEAAGAGRIAVLPLYPQFSATTTGPVYDQAARLFTARRNIPDLRVVHDYHDHPAYIHALGESLRAHWRRHGRAERLLLSCHGIPQACVDRGDPYARQCRRTALRLADALELADRDWSVSYQSRFGRAEWLQPYTEPTLSAWGGEGLASVDVACPGFAADCLETLEEIAIRGREVFERAGGGEFRYVPCLNDSPAHVDMLEQLARAALS